MKTSRLFWAVALVIVLVDQYIKTIFLNGYRYDGECISLILVFNKGVAFSMLSSLGEYLKYIQMVILTGLLVYAHVDKEVFEKYRLEAGLFIGAGFSNLLDRFTQEGVVDYVYWHCGFDFAVFNFADVIIDLAVVLVIYKYFKNR